MLFPYGPVGEALGSIAFERRRARTSGTLNSVRLGRGQRFRPRKMGRGRRCGASVLSQASESSAKKFA